MHRAFSSRVSVLRNAVTEHQPRRHPTAERWHVLGRNHFIEFPPLIDGETGNWNQNHAFPLILQPLLYFPVWFLVVPRRGGDSSGRENDICDSTSLAQPPSTWNPKYTSSNGKAAVLRNTGSPTFNSSHLYRLCFPSSPSYLGFHFLKPPNIIKYSRYTTIQKKQTRGRQKEGPLESSYVHVVMIL